LNTSANLSHGSVGAKRNLKVGFAGTPVFAQKALEAIVEAGYPVSCVLTQPDRPSGRGLKLTPSPVKEWASAAGIPVFQPSGLKLDGRYAEQAQAAHQQLIDCAPDVLVVAAYGLILPQWVLDLPPLGCLNIHASLLPRWRGAAPIQRAIEADDAQTGITIMQMNAGLDTGDMIAIEALNIDQQDTAASLHDKLAILGASLIVRTLEATPLMQAGQAQPTRWSAASQPQAGATYAEKLTKAEAQLNLTQSAQTLERQIRAFNPAPGASVILAGNTQPIKVWQAQALTSVNTQLKPGEVVAATEAGIDIATGQGVLRLLVLQRPGGKRLAAAEFLQGGLSDRS
jgi:methionyl-tRNA formyltransferase